MRRFLPAALVAALLACAVGLAHGFRYYFEWASGSTAQPCTGGSCTRSSPSLATEGMSLSGVSGFRLTVCAASGQTLSGAGTVQAYLYQVDEGAWARDADLDQSISVSGKQCQSFPDFVVPVPTTDRVLFAASGVTVSGGSGLDVLLDAP